MVEEFLILVYQTLWTNGYRRKKMMYGGGAKSYTTENKRYGGGVPNPRMPDPMD